VHRTGASCFSLMDVVSPPAPAVLPIRWLFLPISKFFVSLHQGTRHSLIFDEPEEEDSGLLVCWRGVFALGFVSARLNDFIILGEGSPGAGRLERDQTSMEMIDMFIRWKCSLEGSDVWVGTPLTSTMSYKLLMEHFPEAKFVVCWREPHAAITSALSLGRQIEHSISPEAFQHALISPKEIDYPGLYRTVLELHDKYGDDDRFAFSSFKEWTAGPEEQVARICSRLRLTVVDPSPLPEKSEGEQSAADAAKYKSMAQTLIKRDWEAIWQPIYEAFDYPKPAFV